MAPEQVKREHVRPGADIWALDVLFWEVIKGQRLFQGENEASLIYQIVHQQPATIQQFVPGISPGQIRIIDRSLEKNLKNVIQPFRIFCVI